MKRINRELLEQLKLMAETPTRLMSRYDISEIESSLFETKSLGRRGNSMEEGNPADHGASGSLLYQPPSLPLGGHLA